MVQNLLQYGITYTVCQFPLFPGYETDKVAVVVHLGTMIGGHYIAYTLVDPEKMFEEGKQVLDAVKNLDLNDGHGADGEDVPSMGNGGGKRVWCYCSE